LGVDRSGAKGTPGRPWNDPRSGRNRWQTPAGGAAAYPSDAAAAASLTGGIPCEFLGVINVDYTTERFAGDPDRHVWEGTVGKVLAGVYVRGYQTHAGEYFRGFHAMGLLSRLVTAIDGSNDISGKAPPPVTLKVTDAKDEYNVMTSPAGWAYFNIFTTGNAGEIWRAARHRAASPRYLEASGGLPGRASAGLNHKRRRHLLNSAGERASPRDLAPRHGRSGATDGQGRGRDDRRVARPLGNRICCRPRKPPFLSIY
jgi:hypothetical protein